MNPSIFLRISIALIIIGYFSDASAQSNTVGTLFLNKDNASNGYTLIYPESQNVVYLIDNCGQWVHRWIGKETQGPGKEVYLLEDGTLLRTNTQAGVYQNTFGAGGAGGVVELITWNNEEIWSYIAADSLIRQHHDVEYMPNGNILLILWERQSEENIIASGFDTLSNNQTELWPDKIIEIDPMTDSIVWEWRSWDHMVQDFDSTKLNFGKVEDHPELIDINYQEFVFQRQDIHHINAIDYNPELDQILISVRNFNELWIIDHSTTKEEAASHAGGNSGKGGDLLWRWGNPAAYKRGTTEDQKLFRPHFSNWVSSDILSGEMANSISVYNNFIAPGLSLGQLLRPMISDTGYVIDDTFLPSDFTRTYSHPDTAKNFSTAGSSIQLLENGNVLCCAARQGRIFEIDDSGELVWEYLTPMRNGVAVNQGTTLNLSDNFTFSARKYEMDYPAFQGKDLSPKGFIELNPSDNCLLSSVNRLSDQILIYPNPANDFIIINSLADTNGKMVDMMGQTIKEVRITPGETRIDLLGISKGMYFLILEDSSSSIRISKM